MSGPAVKVKSGILVTPDGVRISYDHYLAGHRCVVIICHGFYNSKQSEALLLLKDGLIGDFDVFMFDFRGHGKSGGTFTMGGKEHLDLETVLAGLRGRYERTGAVAFSLGGAICLNTVSRADGVDSIVCVSAVADVGKIEFAFWELDIRRDLWYTMFSARGRRGKGVRMGRFWLRKRVPSESVKSIRVPILYIHGTDDWVIRPRHSKILYGNTPGEKKLVLIEHGPHAEFLLLYNREETLSSIRDWLLRTLHCKEVA